MHVIILATFLVFFLLLHILSFSLSLFSSYSAYFYGSSDQDWHSSIGVEYVTPRHRAHAEGLW